MLVDHHCHLDFDKFDADRMAVLDRARAAGVGLMVSISTKVSKLNELLQLVEPLDGIFCSVGTHPHYADQELDVPVSRLVELSSHPKVVAIGEAGLDYYYDNAPRDAQAKGLRNHIAAARETGLPLIIHSRDADEDMAAILEEETGKGAFPAVLHCFTGGPDFAKRALALGLYISFSGVVTFKTATVIQEIAAELPLDRILVETDAPYLAPIPHRGKRNEPAFVVHTAAKVAELRGLERSEFAAATTENFFRLYSKVPRNAADGIDVAA